MEKRHVALASGVPRQEVGTFWERLLLPLIHFVLLGFLPISRMRRSTEPKDAAGCGQLFVAAADAYRACAGHAAIRGSLHDGIHLPRLFRTHGFRTDLFDATELASCRMYRSAREVLRGLAKNAVEGLGAPARIVPVTLLLVCGQVLPMLLLACADLADGEAAMAGMAVACAFLPRLLAAIRFDQPWLSAVLHPFGIVVLLGIQWWALSRHLFRRPAEWRGRAYTPQAV
jgi:hypothetical protein